MMMFIFWVQYSLKSLRSFLSCTEDAISPSSGLAKGTRPRTTLLCRPGFKCIHGLPQPCRLRCDWLSLSSSCCVKIASAPLRWKGLRMQANTSAAQIPERLRERPSQNGMRGHQMKVTSFGRCCEEPRYQAKPSGYRYFARPWRRQTARPCEEPRDLSQTPIEQGACVDQGTEKTPICHKRKHPQLAQVMHMRTTLQVTQHDVSYASLEKTKASYPGIAPKPFVQ